MKITRYSIHNARSLTRISHRDSGGNAGSPENLESRIYLYVLIFCLTFVPLNLLVSLTNVASANTAAEIQPPPPDDAAIPQDPNTSRVRQVMKTQIRVLDANETIQSKEGDRLRQVIEQIRSVRFGSEGQQQQGAAPSAASTKTKVIEPVRIKPDAPIRREDPNEGIESSPSRRQVTSETLQMLKDMLGHPEKLDRPLEMGEVLFSCGNVTDAAVFYREALNRMDPNNTRGSRDRAWVLFQIGNCLRKSDRPTASKMYAQLVSEYPQSPWTEMAKAEGKLIDWYIKDNPHAMIDAQKQKQERPAEK